jgi:hypothetical protein
MPGTSNAGHHLGTMNSNSKSTIELPDTTMP